MFCQSSKSREDTGHKCQVGDIPAKKHRTTLQHAKSVPPTFAVPSQKLSEPKRSGLLRGLIFLEAPRKRLRHTSNFAFALTVSAYLQGVVNADAYAGLCTPWMSFLPLSYRKLLMHLMRMLAQTWATQCVASASPGIFSLAPMAPMQPSLYSYEEASQYLFKQLQCCVMPCKCGCVTAPGTLDIRLYLPSNLQKVTPHPELMGSLEMAGRESLLDS